MSMTPANQPLYSTRDECLSAATNAFKNFRATMELVVESWIKNELGTIEELGEAINRSPKTLKTDYVSSLRKQGRLPQARQGKRSGTSKNKCRISGTSVENFPRRLLNQHGRDRFTSFAYRYANGNVLVTLKLFRHYEGVSGCAAHPLSIAQFISSSSSHQRLRTSPRA